MGETPKDKSGWRILRRSLIGLAIFATLIAVFYAEEDWRGKRAWENCKRELEAKGAVLDWNAYIPAPVPDDQNFFKAPKMQNWFVRLIKPPTEPYTNEWRALWSNTNIMMAIANKMVATNYLAWSDQFQSGFDLIREALKRPYARMDGDYSLPFEMPIPNFVAARALAQVLAQRTKCYLLLGQPEKAFDELTLLNDSRRLLEAAPTGKPMTLVAAMINVAVGGLYVDTITYGLQRNAWQEPQLAALQEQLKEINLSPFAAKAFNEERAGVCFVLANTSQADYESRRLVSKSYGISIKPKLEDPEYLFLTFAPRGWVYQNMVIHATLLQAMINSYDLTNDLILVGVANAARDKGNTLSKLSAYSFLNTLFVPNFIKAIQVVTHNQTLVNEAQIVCALERYHLAHGEYPETLDALVPQFIEKLPHDIIGGQPLHYRRTGDGKFLLYSVGWNETDDGGEASDKMDQGDWVWKN